MAASADVVADGLRRAGVARVFVVGDADQALADAVRAVLPVVITPGAASAVAMAEITGRLGDGPGVAVIGADDPAVAARLAEADRARAPTIVVASGPPEASAPVVRTTIAAGAESAAHWAAHAVQAATKEPPGPVWLTVDPDVARRPSLPVATIVKPPLVPLDGDALDDVARRLAASARPLLVAGRECRVPATAVWLRALAEALPAPVLVTPAARGAVPDPHPLCFGPLDAGAGILHRADLVVALGLDADELARAGRLPEAPILRLGRTSQPAESVAGADGDVGMLIEELAPRLRDRARADWDVAELDGLRRARPARTVEPRLAAVVSQLREATSAGTAAVFAGALEPATTLWLTVNPGELFVTDAVVAAALAFVLHRPDHAALVFTLGATLHAPDLAVAFEVEARVIVVGLDVREGDVPAMPAGLRRLAAAPGAALARAIGAALDASGPTLIALG